MGEALGRQDRLFYEFNLEDRVPRDRLPRRIDTVLDLSWLRGRHKAMFGYSLNYLIDSDNAVIVDVEATPTRISKEADATETMIERGAERFALKPDRIAGDVAYPTCQTTLSPRRISRAARRQISAPTKNMIVRSGSEPTM